MDTNLQIEAWAQTFVLRFSAISVEKNELHGAQSVDHTHPTRVAAVVSAAAFCRALVVTGSSMPEHDR